MVKNLPANIGDVKDVDLSPGSGRSPGEENSPVFLPGEFHALYNLWELDTTERLSLSFSPIQSSSVQFSCSVVSHSL